MLFIDIVCQKETSTCWRTAFIYSHCAHFHIAALSPVSIMCNRARMESERVYLFHGLFQIGIAKTATGIINRI